jgi:hypothetical protein
VLSSFDGVNSLAFAYANAAMVNSIKRGEVPISPQQLLNADDVFNTVSAMEYDYVDIWTSWVDRADKIAVYTDLGIDPNDIGNAISYALKRGMIVEFRSIPEYASLNMGVTLQDILTLDDEIASYFNANPSALDGLNLDMSLDDVEIKFTPADHPTISGTDTGRIQVNTPN